MNVLSLFDGMSCGMIAFKLAGIPVDRYVAYEIDKYAVQTSSHNFPEIEHKGDVFDADFTEYEGFDWLIGGSPCTYWSIAQTKNRETTASGLGWDLFSQYVRALRESKPKFFLYENNKSMSKDIRDMIRKTFGFDEICINSALVSAQNRQRYYWVGVRQDDGTYRRADVEQPEDRGILLKDVLDQIVAAREAFTSAEPTHEPEPLYAMPVNPTADGKSGDWGGDTKYLLKNLREMHEKSVTLTATSYKGVGADGTTKIAIPVNPTADGKSGCLTASYYKIAENPFSRYGSEASRPRVAEPVRVGCMPSPDGSVKNSQGMRVYSIEGKSSVQTAQGGGLGAKTGLYAVPVNETAAGKSGTLRATCYKDGIRNLVGNDIDRKTGVAEPCFGRVVGRRINEEGHRADNDPMIECVQRFEVNDDPEKTNCLTTVEKDNRVAEPCAVDLQVEGRKRDADGNWNRIYEAKGNQKSSALTTVESRRMVATPNPQYATAVEWDADGTPTKAVSGADGKTYTVYLVSQGMITINGKTYPIKLADGYWIIRKLTVSECKRLQTVPDWYDFSCVSNTQAYKMLGNGWTCEVIRHLINCALLS